MTEKYVRVIYNVYQQLKSEPNASSFREKKKSFYGTRNSEIAMCSAAFTPPFISVKKMMFLVERR